MAGSKRERELHRAKLARQQKEAAEASERRKRLLTIGGAVVGALAVVGLVVGIALASNSGDSDKTEALPPGSQTVTVAPSPTPTGTASSTAKAEGITCTKPNGKSTDGKQYTKVEANLIPNARYFETMTTNCGVIEFDLASAEAPATTKAMTFLSDRGFYNNSKCHRLTTEGIFVLQCGDPKGDGTGGPGFKVADENLPKAGADGNAVYARGSVAMANAGSGTTGSQFFLVYKDSPLPPNYTVIGKITKGLDVLDHVAAQGTADGSTDGAPKQPVQILKMVSSAQYAADNQ